MERTGHKYPLQASVSTRPATPPDERTPLISQAETQQISVAAPQALKWYSPVNILTKTESQFSWRYCQLLEQEQYGKLFELIQANPDKASQKCFKGQDLLTHAIFKPSNSDNMINTLLGIHVTGSTEQLQRQVLGMVARGFDWQLMTLIEGHKPLLTQQILHRGMLIATAVGNQQACYHLSCLYNEPDNYHGVHAATKEDCHAIITAGHPLQKHIICAPGDHLTHIAARNDQKKMYSHLIRANADRLTSGNSHLRWDERTTYLAAGMPDAFFLKELIKNTAVAVTTGVIAHALSCRCSENVLLLLEQASSAQMLELVPHIEHFHSSGYSTLWTGEQRTRLNLLISNHPEHSTTLKTLFLQKNE